MEIKELYFYIKDYVDANIKSNTDLVAQQFENDISNLSDTDLEHLLLFAGFIPDLYPADSSEETLYSKLVEVLVCVWARKLKFNSRYVKQKASYEDVYMELNNKVIVCDAKSFRLGRSQKAPNVKDFVKLEDIRKWLNRYENKQLGGLITYSDTHEWKCDSDAYQYCSTKDTPTIMLPYKYLALLLHYKENITDLLSLWDFDTIFPEKLKKGDKSKKKYWKSMNNKILEVLNISKEEFDTKISEYDTEIQKFLKVHIDTLENLKIKKESDIKEEISKLSIEEIVNQFINYKIQTEMKSLNDTVKNIKKYRITKK